MRVRSGIVSVSVTTTAGTYKDLADFGYTVDRWQDANSFPPREYTVGSRPGRIGAALLSADPLYEPREVVVSGTVTADTFAAHVSAIEALKGWCARAVALKVSALDGTRVLACSLVGATTQAVGIPGKTPASTVSLTFRAVEDPLWYATTVTSNSLTTSFTEQALGTAPVRPVITFTGAPSGLTLTYADSAGTTVQTMTLAALETSGATQTVVDMSALTVVQTISGVATNAISKITTGDFFALDPKDADTVTPTWPKLKYSATGSVSGVTCAYAKAYW